MKQLIGGAMLLAPGIGILALIAGTEGLRNALIVFGAIAFLILWCFVGAYLLAD